MNTQNISPSQILKDTGIDIVDKESLLAEDFLKVCQYLRIEPESFSNRE